MKRLLYVALLAVGVITLIAPPVMAQEEKPFTLHGETRFGYEYHANTQDFDKNNNADQFYFWPYRVRIAAEGKFAKGVTAWIEFQNGGVFGSLSQPARDGSDIVFTGNDAELYQGNIQLGTLDVYLLNLNEFHAAGEDVTTFGARWSRDMVNKTGLFWNVEYAQQSGDANTTDKAKGNVAEGWIGWNMKSGKNNHRF